MKNLCETGDVKLTFGTPLPIKDTTKIIPEGNISAIDKVGVTKLSGTGVNIKQMDSYFPRAEKKTRHNEPIILGLSEDKDNNYQDCYDVFISGLMEARNWRADRENV